jgi:glycosyltransferase involved in cell wall biosynthesis
MVLIRKITSYQLENYRKDITNCLRSDIDNNYIKEIFIFLDNDYMNLPINNKIKYFIKKNYTDIEIINYSKEISNQENIIFTKSINKISLKIQEVKKNEFIEKDEFIIFKKDYNLKLDKISMNKEIKVNMNYNKKVDVIIVSVNYNKYLNITLSENIKIFKSITVVTSEDDIECQEICKNYGVNYVICDNILKDGLINKSIGINKGIKSINNPDWVLILDADIIVNSKINIDNLDLETIYTNSRFIIDEINDYDLYKRGYKNLSDFKLERDKGIGFFQLFNYKTKNIYNKSSWGRFSESIWTDIKFKNSFKKNISLNLEVIHLGKPYQKWSKINIETKFINSNLHQEDSKDINYNVGYKSQKEKKYRGILLISFGYQYEKLIPNLVSSIRKFCNLPIIIHTNIDLNYSNIDLSNFSNIEFFLHRLNDDENRIIKTNLSKYTKFDKTLYIDADSVVLSGDFLKPFDDLDDYDICSPVIYDNLTLDNFTKVFKSKQISSVFEEKISKNKDLFSKNFFILGGGICYFRKSKQVDTFFEDFYNDWCVDKKRDMPSLIYAYYKNIKNIKLKKLKLSEYNDNSSSVIKSLHYADVKHNEMKKLNFTRRRFNTDSNKWEFFKQGEKKFSTLYKIAILYDSTSWAFYIIANNIKRYLSDYYDIDVMQYNQNKTEKEYDIYLTFSPLNVKNYMIKNRLIVGISSHKNFNLMKKYNYVLTNDMNIFKNLDNEKKFYIPNGVDTKLFKTQKRENVSKNIKLGLVSSLLRRDHKGSNRFDEIVLKLRNKGYKIEDKKLIVDSNVPEKIKSQKEMVDYYNYVDIFIISSLSETGPNPLLESMSMGIPVVSNKVGLAPILIDNGETGFIIEDFNDIDEYVNCISRLIDDRKLYNRISKNSIEKIKDYDWSEISIQYKSMFDSIIEKNNKSDSI